MHLIRYGHFPSRNKNDWIGSAIPENTDKSHGVMAFTEPELWAMEVYIAGIWNFLPFLLL